MLQGASEFGTGGVFDAATGHMPGNPHIKEVELGRPGDEGAGTTAAERLHEDAEQGVDENLEVFAHRLGIDSAIPGDAAVVQRLSVAERKGVEEAGERGRIARQTLFKHLFLQVVIYVAGKRPAVIRRIVVLRNHLLCCS